MFQLALILIIFHEQELREEVENWGGQARELQRVSRREVADLPPDTQVGFLVPVLMIHDFLERIRIRGSMPIRILLFSSVTFKTHSGGVLNPSVADP